jgi:hypothetical protein
MGEAKRGQDVKRSRIGLIAGLVGLLSGLASPVWAGTKALVFNATGEDLKIVVNGRGNLHPWASPVVVYGDEGKPGLLLETANTDGELLKSELEGGQAYVMVFRDSTKLFALWKVDELKKNLDKILDDNPGAAKAAVFNSTGRGLVFRFGQIEQGVGRELCVFTPNATDPANLKFEFVVPDLGPRGPVAPNSIHVVSYDEAKGYSFQTFQDWSAELFGRLKGGTGPAKRPGGATSSSGKVGQQDLHGG